MTVGGVDSGDLPTLSRPTGSEIVNSVFDGTNVRVCVEGTCNIGTYYVLYLSGPEFELDYIAQQIRSVYESAYPQLRSRNIQVIVDMEDGYITPDGNPARKIVYTVLVNGQSWTPPTKLNDGDLKSAFSNVGVVVWYPYEGIFSENQQFEVKFNGTLTAKDTEKHLVTVWRRVYTNRTVNVYVYRVLPEVSPKGSV